MTNFPGPPTWAANTAYTARYSQVNGGNGFYYVASVSGVSGGAHPTWASVFGTAVIDNTVTWVTAQRSRQPWQAHRNYTASYPLVVGNASVPAHGNTVGEIELAQFVGIGSYIVDINYYGGSTLTPFFAQVIGVNVAASTITVASISGSTTFSNSFPATISLYPYPWPDQIVTGGAGSPVAQCTVTGTSGGSQPTWPFTVGASVADGSAVWVTVAIN